MDQTSIWDFLCEEQHLTKKLRLIEAFAGYGSQSLALDYLSINYESHKIIEWAVKSIQAYKDMHFGNDKTDYSKGLTDDQVRETLFQLGISSDYSHQMKLEEIKKRSGKWCRQVYNNIKATHNLVNISNVKGSDLELQENDKYDYLLTYSFPCQ